MPEVTTDAVGEEGGPTFLIGENGPISRIADEEQHPTASIGGFEPATTLLTGEEGPAPTTTLLTGEEGPGPSTALTGEETQSYDAAYGIASPFGAF